jgi:putative membrane protein
VPAARTPLAAQPKLDVDALFLRAAMQGNAGEIDLAQLALQRSTVLEVRGFAQKMIDEHTQLGGRLAEAAPHAAAPAERDNPIDRLALERLAGLSAVDFDQQYLLQQIGDHLATIDVFDAEARDGRNPALKGFAADQLPELRAHLALAVDEVKHVGGDTPFYTH